MSHEPIMRDKALDRRYGHNSGQSQKAFGLTMIQSSPMYLRAPPRPAPGVPVRILRYLECGRPRRPRSPLAVSGGPSETLCSSAMQTDARGQNSAGEE